MTKRARTQTEAAPRVRGEQSLPGMPVTPNSVRKLLAASGGAVKLQRLAADAAELQREIDRTVVRLRSQGASWAAIGWLTGMTDNGARKRWDEGA